MSPVFHGLLSLLAFSNDDQWIKVSKHSENQVQGSTLTNKWTSFADLKDAVTNEENKEWKTEDLKVPLAPEAFSSLGLGLSYPSHQEEVKTDATVFFKKNAVPTRISDAVKHRPHLDYEAEVSLLLHRSEPNLFGYLIHNDLTDRGVQVKYYDEKNPAPGFSRSKSYPSFNAHGVLLAIGSEALWNELQLTLYRNGEEAQRVSPSENVMTPSMIHKHVFARPELSEGKDWVLIGTGTPAGTIFNSPSKLQRIWLFISSGFSMKRAQEKWLNRFDYLKEGDVLEFRSELLGHISTEIVAP